MRCNGHKVSCAVRIEQLEAQVAHLEHLVQHGKSELEASENRNQQLQQMSKAALAVSQKGFDDKLKSLKKQLQEQEAQLADDDTLIEQLKMKLKETTARLKETGVTSPKAAAADQDAAAQNAAMRALERHNKELTAAAEASTAQLASMQGTIDSLQTQVRRKATPCLLDVRANSLCGWCIAGMCGVLCVWLMCVVWLELG